MFAIEFTPGAIDDLRQLRKYDQQRISSAVETQLAHQPDNESRNRKRLRPSACLANHADNQIIIAANCTVAK